MRKTVESYSSDEPYENGIGEEIKKKGMHRSVLLPLLLSVLAAIGIWSYVVSENNTVNGIGTKVYGNERLMSNGYSVSSIDLQSIDVVLRGKADAVKQVINDKSQIEARINVFKNSQFADGKNCYIFEDENAIRPGTYTVSIEFVLPDGVTCSDKTAKVTISDTASRTFDVKNDVKFTFTNYSLAPNCTIRSISAEQETLTISGDVKSVDSIASIAVVTDWSKEISSDLTINNLVPVAYDSEGDVIDSQFLRFEPAYIQLNVSVNKSKELRFDLLTDPSDNAVYTFSQDSVVIEGPVKLIDKFKDIYCLNWSSYKNGDTSILSTYTINGDDIARAVTDDPDYTEMLRIVGSADTVTIEVNKFETTKTLSLSIAYDAIKVLIDDGYDYGFDGTHFIVNLSYGSIADAQLDEKDLLCVLDLRGVKVGENTVVPSIAFYPHEGVYDPKLTQRVDIRVHVTEKASLESKE